MHTVNLSKSKLSAHASSTMSRPSKSPKQYRHFQNSNRPNQTSSRPPPNQMYGSHSTNGPREAYTNPFQQRYGEVDSSPAYISFNVISYLSSVMIIFLFIMMIIKCFKKNTDISKMSESKRGKIILLFVIFMFLSFLAVDGIAIAFGLNDLMKNTLSDKQEYRRMIAYVRILYRFGRLILTMFFLARMYMCFMSTPLQISKKSVFMLLFVYFTFCWLLGTFANAAYLIKEIELREVVSILNLISFIVDMLINTLILCLFIRKLFDFMIGQKGQNKANIIDTIVKNTVLCIWGVCSSFVPEIFCIVSVYLSSDNDGGNEKKGAQGSPIDPILLCILLVIDGAINCLCVYLSFSWAQREYEFVCRCCAKCLNNACIRCTEKWIEKKRCFTK